VQLLGWTRCLYVCIYILYIPHEPPRTSLAVDEVAQSLALIRLTLSTSQWWCLVPAGILHVALGSRTLGQGSMVCFIQWVYRPKWANSVLGYANRCSAKAISMTPVRYFAGRRVNRLRPLLLAVATTATNSSNESTRRFVNITQTIAEI